MGFQARWIYLMSRIPQWRGMYLQAVDRYWTDKISAEAAEKSSLKCMNTQKYSIG